MQLELFALDVDCVKKNWIILEGLRDSRMKIGK